MAYKTPNLKGPRVKKKSSHVMGYHSFKEFLKKHPEHKGLKLSEFNTILRKFNTNIVDEVVNYRYGVVLPERLGSIVIASFPRSKKKIIDFGTSNKTGVKSYHRNWDTDNRVVKIMYQNATASYTIKHHRLWTFEPIRSFQNKVSTVFKKRWERYIFIDNKHTTLKKMLK